jgi:hypothetical protein
MQHVQDHLVDATLGQCLRIPLLHRDKPHGHYNLESAGFSTCLTLCIYLSMFGSVFKTGYIPVNLIMMQIQVSYF